MGRVGGAVDGCCRHGSGKVRVDVRRKPERDNVALLLQLGGCRGSGCCGCHGGGLSGRLGNSSSRCRLCCFPVGVSPSGAVAVVVGRATLGVAGRAGTGVSRVNLVDVA